MASDFALLFRARRIRGRRRQRIPWKQRGSHGRQAQGYQRRIEVSDEQVVEVSDDHGLVSPGSWSGSSQSGKCPKPTKNNKGQGKKARKFIASIKRSLCAQWLDKLLASFLVAEESVCVRLGKSRGDNVLTRRRILPRSLWLLRALFPAEIRLDFEMGMGFLERAGLTGLAGEASRVRALRKLKSGE